jgi:DNA-binding IclR family transcriptional regulator
MNNTLVKGLGLLEKLAREGRQMGVTEIATITGYPKSGAHRLLQALVDEGYVTRSDAGLYAPSIKLWELGSSALQGFDLRQRACAVMEELAQALGETVHLSVLDDHEVVYVHKVDSDHPVRAYTQIGGRAPAHCVATGKAMMAHRTRGWLCAAASRLRPFTRNTITDRNAFLHEMQQVRRDGFAMNFGEWRPDVHGLAAPVLDATGTVIAAVGISGPARRLDRLRLVELSPSVLDAARALSSELSEAAPHASLLSVTSHWGTVV